MKWRRGTAGALTARRQTACCFPAQAPASVFAARPSSASIRNPYMSGDLSIPFFTAASNSAKLS